ncbi:MAG: bifunctional riboflavin kinase/FAD synthetase [Candidatus Aminicenantes bacterium]|nr:bifunctional riboflavin kinase/FAD synthetase [Candidatus Aminicenantes bacterium]
MISKMNMDDRKNSVIAVGNFDGFHFGHRKIVATLKEIAAREHLLSHIVTFTPNPRLYFKKEKHLIFTDVQKKKILTGQSIDRVIFINFNEIAHIQADDFIKDFLIGKFGMKYIVVGDNFQFGRDRKGNIEFLEETAGKFDFKLRVVEPVLLNGVRVSSSHIRERLARGEFEEANALLGRLYCIEGCIIEGDKMGRELGFPTINVKTDNLLLPEGVFKSKVEIDHETFAAITNIGWRPTFSGMEKRVEAHLFEFDRVVYGKEVKIYFESKLRDEIKFASKDNLIVQIKKDIENLRI